MQKEDIDKKYFSFKEFRLQDFNTTMKIGTDAILLGSCASKYSYDSVLDIGSGCGIVALMLLYARQKSCATMVEIDSSAVLDIKENIKQKFFLGRCNVINGDIKKISIEEKFDLIVSNPPYFSDCSFLPHDKKRVISRHENNSGLDINTLIKVSFRLLKPEGRICLIIPFDRLSDTRNYVVYNNLMIDELIEIYTNTNKKDMPKRIILSIRHINKYKYVPIIKKTLFLTNPDGTKHSDYINLTSDFF